MFSIFGIFQRPGGLFKSIFDKNHDFDILIDGSKDLKWALWNSSCKYYDSYFVVLDRDIRALVSSRIRKFGGTVDEITPKVLLWKHSLNKFLSRNLSNVISIEYEHLFLTQHPLELNCQSYLVSSMKAQ